MERLKEPPVNAQIWQEACEWFVEFRTGQLDEAARRAFYVWLRESSQHIGAYLQITALWNESAALDVREKWTPAALIAEAADDASNIVALDAAFHAAEKLASCASDEANRRVFRSLRGRALAVAACVCIALTGLFAWLHIQRSTYVTAIGEQRFLALADGSTLNLNSRSRVRVRYSGRERVVELQEGQALFEVARDPTRPFVVISGSTRVRAVGTQFDVYRKHADTIVTVVEGRVAVQRKESSGSPEIDSRGAEALDSNGSIPSTRERGRSAKEVVLSAGQQLLVASSGFPRPVSADIARATSWTQRQLVFESTPLAEVAEEFNRYNARQMVIRTAELNSFQIDGVFSSTDPASLIRFLRTRPGVYVTETDSQIAIGSH